MVGALFWTLRWAQPASNPSFGVTLSTRRWCWLDKERRKIDDHRLVELIDFPFTCVKTRFPIPPPPTHDDNHHCKSFHFNAYPSSSNLASIHHQPTDWCCFYPETQEDTIINLHGLFFVFIFSSAGSGCNGIFSRRIDFSSFNVMSSTRLNSYQVKVSRKFWGLN